MTPISENINYRLISHCINIKNNKNILNNVINNSPNILTKFINNYNKLSDDVKELLNYSDKLQNTICSLQNAIYSLQNKISRLKSEYNELHKQLYECKQKLSRAEARAQQITEFTTEPENICIICMTNPRECAYVNCGHVCACIDCCMAIGDKCPICRQNGNYIKLINV